MKKNVTLPIVAFLCILFGACKKDSLSANDKNDYGNNPRAENIPAALSGRWQYGVFSMSQYGDYSGGGTSGSASEVSVTYQINSNGTGTEFFYSAIRNYYSVTEVLGKRYGTYTIDAQSNKLTFYAASGNYYQVYTVVGGSPKKGEIKEYTPGGKDLYPNYKASYEFHQGTDNQGKPSLILKYPSGDNYAFSKMD
jgi:hypothetical protein